jgi:hypothetical protein
MRENFRYFSIIDGTNLTNEDESGIPKYYGYTRPGGSWVIMRYNETNGTYDFALNSGNANDPFVRSSLSEYDTAWTNRASLTYKRSGELKPL